MRACFNRPADLAVHRASGDIAIVGNYTDEHVDADGNSMPTSTSFESDIYVQTLDSNGGHLGSQSSEGNQPLGTITPGDFREATAIAFSLGADKKVYITGSFQGRLEGNQFNGLAPGRGNTALITGSDDTDWFLVGYASSNLVRAEKWQQSGLMSLDDDGRDIALDIYAGEAVIAVVGAAVNTTCNDPEDPNCTDGTGFVEVFTQSQSPQGSLGNYFKSFSNQSPSVHTVDLASDDFGDQVRVGGLLEGSNIDLGGGALPGAVGFFASFYGLF